jgi:hypothetical protein
MPRIIRFIALSVICLLFACDDHSEGQDPQGSIPDGANTHLNTNDKGRDGGLRDFKKPFGKEWAEAGLKPKADSAVPPPDLGMDGAQPLGGWIKHPNNPVIGPGPAGSWNDGTSNTPSVAKVNGTYMLWYKTGTNGVFDSVALASSADGINWNMEPTAVFTGGSGWDERLDDHTVDYDGTTYRMWYAAFTDGELGHHIGLATSTDGKKWNRHGNAPVLSPGGPGEWGAVSIMAPAVIVDGNQFHMWYKVGFSQTPNFGYATSSDGITWSKSANNPCKIPVNQVYSFDMVKDGASFRMVYHGSAGNPEGDYFHATSSDGINWNNTPSTPIIMPGGIGSSDEAIFRPTIAWGDAGKLVMWYSAGYSIPDSPSSIHFAYEL